MKVKGLQWLLVAGLAPFAHAADVNKVAVPGMISDGSEWSIIAGHTGRKVALSTVQSLVGEDSDSSLDSYLLDLDDGSIELLVPEPATGSVALEAPLLSFVARNFSDDGNRLLLGGNSNILSAAHGTAAVVFDFSTNEYIPASILPDNVTSADRVGNEVLSGDGRYVLFSNGHATGFSSWDLTWYRRDLENGSTKIALTRHDGTPAIDSEDASFRHISGDGRYLLGYARDGVLDPADTNGVVDYFIVDIETNMAERIDAITAEGETLDPVDITPSPGFDYLLLRFSDPEIISRIGTDTVFDYWAVYEVATGKTVGLTEFLGVPSRFMQIWDGERVGSGFAFWGASSRYMAVSQGALALPGDSDYDSKHYIIDRETGTGWIAGMDNEGTIHRSYTNFARADGGVLKYLAGEDGDEVSVLEYAPLTRDLSLRATAKEGQFTLKLINNGADDIYNAGVSIVWSRAEANELSGLETFDACRGAEIYPMIHWDCSIDFIAAGTSKEFTLTLDNAAEVDLVAGLLSDRDARTGDNSALVQVDAPSGNGGGDTGGGNNDGDGDSDTGGSGGGGPFSPFLLVLLALVASRPNRSGAVRG